MSSDFNRKVYELPVVVNGHTDFHLDPPEITIKKILLNDLPKWRMFDIGVGTGRTTEHFANIVKAYVGVDYSLPMVSACKRKFSHRFELADVRDLSKFKGQDFDFILFSNNGIDTLNHKDRLKALAEITQVGHKGTYFCFSTHNLQSAGSLRKKEPYKAKWMKQLRMGLGYLQLRIQLSIYQTFKQCLTHMILRDGAEAFRLQLYYVRPDEQIQQLQQAGFSDIRIFSTDGHEVNLQELPCTKDRSLYFLCRI